MEALMELDRPRAISTLDDYFSITARGSSIRTEIFAGFINFLANSYLLVLTPQLLHHGASDGSGYVEKASEQYYITHILLI